MAGLKQQYGQKRVNALGTLIIVGLASSAIILLARQDLHTTAVLYLAVPYSVAVLITMLRPYHKPQTWWGGYISHSVSALVVFLGSSILLMEGFICVLFFIPIYLLFVTLAFVTHALHRVCTKRTAKTHASAIPLLVVLLSTEGTSELTTFDRFNAASATATTVVAREDLLQNLADPVVPSRSGDWMLGIFPMPHTIEGGSLKVGSVHRLHTRYRRWFVTNTHEGIIELRIDEASPGRVRATFVSDTSHFSSYVKLLESDIRLEPGTNGQTHVSLTITYERRLDPAWYFQPIQQYAMTAMARHVIQEVIIRE